MNSRQFFNPYLNNLPPSVLDLPPNISPDGYFPDSIGNYYEGQYYYFRYLNEMLDYTIKREEYLKTHPTTQKN